jgi:tRNA threonylcarbamoyladenosine biosynthesis protein TsaE
VNQISQELIAYTEEDLPAVVQALLGFAGGRKKFTLSGDLGAGKTALTKAFCRHFGVQDLVTSPTFSLVNEYYFRDETGKEQTIHHLDLYRLRNLDEAYGIGIEDYLYDDFYTLIEWPGLIEDLLPDGVVNIKISILPDSSRKILFLSA